MPVSWLETLILKSAAEIELSGRAIFQFSGALRESLRQKPVQEWENALWARGLKTRLIRMEGYFFRIGQGKRSCLSFFVRNERGLHVGLRREAITQAATYVTLVTDYGYARKMTRFETGWMDVAVFDAAGKAFIYAENKAHEKTLQKLCARLAGDFNEIPAAGPEDLQTDDALMKAHHIWRHRPRYFWGVCPTSRLPYAVSFDRNGFRLLPVEAIPRTLEN